MRAELEDLLELPWTILRHEVQARTSDPGNYWLLVTQVSPMEVFDTLKSKDSLEGASGYKLVINQPGGTRLILDTI
jgi:hypothetical protein